MVCRLFSFVFVVLHVAGSHDRVDACMSKISMMQCVAVHLSLKAEYG